MLSVPKQLDVDPELLQVTLYPVKELELLRRSPAVHHQTALSLPEGVTPLAGVDSSTLDLELTFDWSQTASKQLPTTPNLQVGVAVLLGAIEQTLVTLTLGAATRFNNGTRKAAPAVLLSVDSRLSRADREGGAATPMAVTLKEHEAGLAVGETAILRAPRFPSVLEAPAKGRGGGQQNDGLANGCIRPC